MKLQDTDWSNARTGARLVDVEYPDDIIQRFVNWLWTTKQWRENPEAVYNRFRRMQDELVEWKQKHPKGAVPVEADARASEAWSDAPFGEAWLRKQLQQPTVAETLERMLKEQRAEKAKANRKAALDKARQAKRAKRATVEA